MSSTYEAWTYNPAGQVLTSTDALGRTTGNTYSLGGRLRRVTYADSTEREYDYDTFGNLIAETDELGHTTTRTYNEYQRVATVTDPLGRTTSFQYGLSPTCSSCAYTETLTRITYPSDRKIERTYDASGQLLTEINAAGTPLAATTTRVYSAAGNVASLIDPLGHTTTFTYDLRRQLLTSTDPLGRVTTATYDAVGNTLSRTRHDGSATTFAYDNRDRLSARTDALNQVVGYTYDAMGRLQVLTDTRGSLTMWAYDFEGRLLTKTYADASTESWAYDVVGNITQSSTPASVTCTYTYDVRNREITADWSDATPDVTRSYDADGRLVSQTTSGVVTHTYTYDAANQLLSETSAPVALAPTTFVVTYAYDADGRRTDLTYPDGGTVDYAYNARSEIETISADGPPPLATFAYDLDLRRTSKTLENGVVTTYAHDNANQVTGLVHTSGAGELARFTYTYDSGGRRTGKAITGPGTIPQAETYAYDAIDQLTAATYGTAGSESFAYDPMGNRTSATLLGSGATSYTTNTLNQYTAISSLAASPTYDLNGNLLSLPASATGTPASTYTYDGQNRLTAATVGTATTATFTYDAYRRQVSRTINGTTTWFVWDGWSLLAEYQLATGIATQVARYVHGPRLDEILVQQRATNPTPLYLHEDALGSTYLVTDAAASVVERYTYTAYGQVTAYDTLGATVSAPATRFLYTGREWLADLGLNDHRNRFYNPTLGRWLNRDPIGENGGINIYRTIQNSPVNGIDPDGLQTNAAGNSRNRGNAGRARGAAVSVIPPRYGNWGGGGWSGGVSGNSPPVNSFDACFQAHDQCYGACPDVQCNYQRPRTRCLQACDQALSSCLAGAGSRDSLDPLQRLFVEGAATLPLWFFN